LDREFSKNAPYKQKIIFHSVSSDKMSRKKIILLGRWISGIFEKWVVGQQRLNLLVFALSLSRMEPCAGSGAKELGCIFKHDAIVFLDYAYTNY